MSSLSEISIRRPVFAWMLMAAIILFGALSFKQLGVSQLPDVDFPVVSISLSLNGAAPAVMESQVIDPLEDALMQIGGIRNINSSSSQSSGDISIEFELDRNIDEAVQDVQNRIAQVRNVLPQDLRPPMVRKTNPEDQPVMWIALSTNDPKVPIQDTMMFARNTLFDQFATIPGVGDIKLGGYVDPALRMWLDSDKLNKLSITAEDIVQTIQNEHVEAPAGRIENNKKEFNVRLMGEAKNPEEFGKIRLNNRGGGANYSNLQLKDLGKIEEGTIDVRRMARFNGDPAVGLGIMKQHGSNAVEVAKMVREKFALIQKTLPPQYSMSIRNDTSIFIRQSVDQLNFTLLLSAILTSLVCFVFLGSWTSTMNVLMAIPTSIIGTFMGIRYFGFTLNTFTLLGLSLAIGVVVDDAIMMLENIVRHRELGQKRKEAALKGSKEITFAAVAATIAVVAIFLPVVFMKGVIGKYFFQYGVTVTIAVLLSLVEALTLTPMRCSRYLKVEHHTKGFSAKVDSIFSRLSVGYLKLLHVLLRHRWITLFTTFVFFAGSILISKTLPSEMLPAQDQSKIMLRFKAPVGSSLEYTNEKMKKGEEIVRAMPEVEGIFSMVGGFGGDAVNQGNAFVTLVDPKKRKLSQSEMMKKIREVVKQKLKGIQVIAQDLSLRGFASGRGFPIEFIVQGPDWDTLTSETNKVIEECKNSGFATDVNTDIQPNMPELKITPNRDKLALRGVAMSSVSAALNSLVGGAILNGQTEYEKNGHRYQIELRLKPEQRDEAEQLKKILVRNNRGELVRLSDVVDITSKPNLMTISRLNRSRAITVYGNLAPGHTQQEVLKKVQEIGKSVLAPGYFLKLTGSSQSFKESISSLIFALLFGIIISYMVLASQFNSFIHPFTVLLALPFSISGAFIGLALFHQSINIYSMIGFILLMGIVKKNSILLVDFTNQCRSEGLSVNDALFKACPVRLRPIIMTSLAVVVGALPEALSMGPGTETTIPMAVAIIGGVIVSTVLTLLVVPCAYSLMTKLEKPDSLGA